TSMDVIHSYGVPVLRVKQDADPGMEVPIWFKAIQTGTFDIVCSQLCGVGHSLMKGVITVDSPEAFQKWFDEQPKQFKPKEPKPAPKAADSATDKKHEG
ncbi:MAG: cytochrome c oxidase subunit II, partial [Deltaproteobacteria bacterium]|nr:cytochrome c oxidase subunit II [Deltaproteobacteria bacterium]